jgi:hypothetical protein
MQSTHIRRLYLLTRFDFLRAGIYSLNFESVEVTIQERRADLLPLGEKALFRRGWVIEPPRLYRTKSLAFNLAKTFVVV